MAITSKILNPVSIPDELEIEIKDTICGSTTVVKVNINLCFREMKDLWLERINSENIVGIIHALAEHHAIDDYLISVGVDPHKDVIETITI